MTLVGMLADTGSSRVQAKELPRKLGLLDATTVLVGTVIGSGIFLTPSFIARTVRYPGLMILVWILGGVLSLCGALTYAEMGALRPRAGGQYVFLRDAFGPLISFLYGWSAFWIIHSGTLAAVSVAFAIYLDQLVALPPLLHRLVPIIFIAALTFLNCVGVNVSKWYQNVTTFLKLGAIAALVSASFVLGRPAVQNFHPLFPPSMSLGTLTALATAMMGALFAYEGWSFVTYTAGEIRDARKNLPIAMIFGTLVLIIVYCTTNLSYMINLRPDEMAASDRVAALSAQRMLGPAGGAVIAAVILLCLLGATNGVVLTGPRIYYAMSRDKLFFHRLAAIHPRFETPVYAILAQGVWASILAVSGTYERLFTFVLLGAWAFYAVTAVGLFIYRKRETYDPRSYRTWGYPAVPIIFVATAVLLVSNTVAHSPQDSLICLVLVALGIPAYVYWRSRSRSQCANDAPMTGGEPGSAS